MRGLIDVHLHTARCGHACGDIVEYVDAAVARGLEWITFTDHLPLFHFGDNDYAMPWEELDEYVSDVLDVAESRSDIQVLLGIEADWTPDRAEETRAVLDRYPFDCVLGSVHFIDGWAFDDPRLKEGYSAWTPEALWDRYFELLGEAAASGLFDVMAHPDLVKKFAYWPADEQEVRYERVAHDLARAGMAVEINTAGLRNPCAEIYPSPAFLAVLRRAGVGVTVGSDAHRPEDVGRDLDAAVDLLRSTGYESVLVFRARERHEVLLP